MNGCIFCNIAQKKTSSNLAYEDNDIIAFYDINPVAPTHILIIPKKHIDNLNTAGPEDAELIGKINLVAAKIAKEKGFAEEGYRLVSNCNELGGQTVFHLHYHLIGERQLAWPPG